MTQQGSTEEDTMNEHRERRLFHADCLTHLAFGQFVSVAGEGWVRVRSHYNEAGEFDVEMVEEVFDEDEQ
jgi:hypothetical protein